MNDQSDLAKFVEAIAGLMEASALTFDGIATVLSLSADHARLQAMLLRRAAEESRSAFAGFAPDVRRAETTETN